jgi:hypothetical protein
MELYEFNLQRFADGGDGEQPAADSPSNTEVNTGLEPGIGLRDGELFFLDEEDSSAEEQPVVEENVEPVVEDTPRKFRVKVAGEELEVDESELLNGYSRQADYTRAKQELAREREQLRLMQEQFHQMRTPQQPEVNVPQLNPAEILAYRAEEEALKILNSGKTIDTWVTKETFDHWNSVHRAAYDLAMNSILTNMRNEEARLSSVMQFETRLQNSDPDYVEIKQFAEQSLRYLPYEEHERYKNGFVTGDVEVMNELYQKMKKAYNIYTGKEVINTEPETKLTVEQRATVVPPMVETSKQNAVKPNVSNRPDYTELRDKTFDEQLKLMEKWNIKG